MNNIGFNVLATVILVASATMYVTGAGMKVYEDAMHDAFSKSAGVMSTQEKDAFNNQFTIYEGAQTGSKVKALIGVLIANSKTYEDEITKIPTLTVVDKATVKGENANVSMNAKRPEVAGDSNDYVENIIAIKNEIEEKHTYWVETVFGTMGVISEIQIYYSNSKL